MSIALFIQWISLFTPGCKEFDFITVSFRRGYAAGNWQITVVLLGIGISAHYLSEKAFRQYLSEIVEKPKEKKNVSKNNDMTLEEKLEAIDRRINDEELKDKYRKKNGLPPDAPVDPAELTKCDGCE